MFTAAQVEEKVNEYDENQDHNWEHAYEQLHDGEDVKVPGLGKLEHVDSYGGEGDGDDYWVVFRLGEQLFRKNGWYASYDGGYLDGELYEVKPVPVQRVEYERI